MNTSTVLWYDKPARRWTEALPLGNGSLGAMVHGRYDCEKISLNLDTLWSGRPYESQNIPGAYEAYRQARSLALSGDCAAAEKLLEETMLSARSGQTYLPLGELNIDYRMRGRVENYSRRLDLETAVHTVRWDWICTDGTIASVQQECFVSNPGKCLVLHMTCEAGLSMEIGLTSALRHASFTENGLLILDGQAPGMTTLLRDGFENENGMFMRVVCGVRTDGRLRAQGSQLIVEKAADVRIVLAAEDSFNGFDKDPVSEGKDCKRPPVERVQAALSMDYAQLREAHVRDHAALFGRVRLDLGETPCGERPTDDRLIAHEEGAADPSLYALLFNYGRYLGIAASRPGSQAMNLQGIWNDRLYAPWSSNYTVNINTEMNYWPMLPGNLAELNEPLIDMLRELAVAGREMAEDIYHAPGWACHHNTDLWRQTFPAYGRAMWGFWYNGGAWLSRHLYEHYLYTMDEEFLRETAYPLIRGCAEFYLSQMEEVDGWLVLPPSTSPENSYILPEGTRCSTSLTTAMTMSIARETLENALDCAKRQGISDDFCAQAEAALGRLLPLRVGSDGRLMEWYDERPDAEVHHRHVSHLYALHPARQIDPSATPELAEACRRTLEVRGDDGTGWSLGWKINFWARLRDGDHALKLLDTQLRFVSEDGESRNSSLYSNGGGTYANLFDAHPPFQIDGNFGAASGILEMLMQPCADGLHLLPALPTAWKDGSVSGLKAPGDIAVSLDWRDGELARAVLESKRDVEVRAIISGKLYDIRIRNGRGEWIG